MTQPTALERAIETAGSQTAFARAVGASQQIVSYWVARGKPLPAEFVLKAEASFGISRHDLRPDIYPTDHAPADSSVTDASSPDTQSDHIGQQVSGVAA